ncbi:MAG: T9SS type A sorting domain-containing protein [Cyclobacteriaceae bacterium]
MKFKSLIPILILGCLFFEAGAQQTIINNTGNTIKLCSGTVLTVKGDYLHSNDDAELSIDEGGIFTIEGSLINQSVNALTSGDTGEIRVGGDSIYSLQASTFHSLVINQSNPPDTMKFVGNITITDSLYLQSGNLFSQNDTLFMVFYENGDIGLQTFGDLTNEGASTRLITNNPGNATTAFEVVSNDLNLPGINLANLGLTIALPGANGALLEIDRSNDTSEGLINGSIARKYEISFPNPATDGTLVMEYFDVELDTLPAEKEVELRLFNSKDGGNTWSVLDGMANTGTNEITATGVDDINGAWTASYCNKPDVSIQGDLVLCAATSGTVTASVSQSAAYTYQWYRDGVELTGETSANLSFEIADGSIEFIVHVRDQYGCLAGDTTMVSVNQLPVVSLGEDVRACPESSVQLDAGSGFSSYEWFDKTGASIGDTQILEVMDSSIYVVQVTNESGCLNADTITVSYFPVPVSTLDSDVFVCGNSFTFGSELESLNPGAMFEWTDESGATLSTSAEITVTNNGDYFVEIINSDGCSSMDTVSVELSTTLPLPDLDLGSNRQFCTDEVITISAGDGFESYLWSTGSTDTEITVSQPGDYFVSVINSVGCSASDTINVIHFDPIDVDFGNQIATCGDEMELGVELEALNPGASFLWSPGGETTSSIMVSEEGFYEVTITDTNGCSLTAGTDVILNETDFVSLGEDISIQCESIVLDAGLSGEYLWSTGSIERSINVESSGLYWVEVIDVNGCVDRDSLNIEVLPTTDSAFYLVATEALVGDTLVFIGLPTSEPDSIVWDWKDGSDPLTGYNLFPTHIYESSGTYQPEMITVFDNGCIDEYFKVVTITEIAGDAPEGEEENGRTTSVFNEVIIYPNPNDGLFSAEIFLNQEEELSWLISDLLGDVVLSGSNELSMDHELDFDIRSVQAGVYVLQIVADSEKRSFRISVRY